jgi:acylphosphatase
MPHVRLHLFYSGRVQGVGFRYAARQAASGYEVTGVIRNLPDGRVEMLAEGERSELEAFQEGIREAGLRRLIRDEQTHWSEASGEFRGFEIVR